MDEKFIQKIEHVAEDAVESLEHAAEEAADRTANAVHGIEEQALRQVKGLTSAVLQFFRFEAAGGLVLMTAAALALIVANTDLHAYYDYILNGVDFRIGFSDDRNLDLELKKSILLWINDGLMAIFFFLIGLEIKREIVEGELSSRDRVLLPFLAALGGMAVPALIFFFFNQGNQDHLRGWAVPAATDIAFALGVISLLGSRVPLSLKILLTAIAIIDDLLAILIIAVFYSHKVIPGPLWIAGAAILLLFILNRRNVTALAPYILVALVLWGAVLESGIHATLAGVVAALFIPMHGRYNKDYSPCKTLEHDLHPLVAFGVLPVFGFANAGVSFEGLGPDIFLNPVTLGIALGLFAGKQIGVFTCLFLAVKTGLSPMPKNANWRQLYAVSVLCGIGFTMSLFIGGLAFHSVDMQASVRLGVLAGSILSAALGYALLRAATPAPKAEQAPA